jgi:PAS domain S-box-containing protein
LLEAILDTAHEAFISIDDEGRIRAWNREAERTFGWARESVVGRRLSETVIPLRYRERHEQGLRRFLETGEGPLLDKRIEITAIHRSGHEFPVELTISSLRHGNRWTFHAFLHDISPRYRAQEAQARLATLVEHSADAIITRNADGIVTSWNPGAERVYGYSAGEMLGRTVDRLVPPERAGEAEELLARALRGEAINGVETQRLRKDDSLIDVSIAISPIRDDAGRVSELSMIARDITARKQTERELARASELKSQFVAITSHELRTPLTSVAGFARTMLARWDEISDADKRRFLETIDEQGDRLRRLVDNLLLVSRIEAGKLGGVRAPVDLTATAQRAASELDLEQETKVEDSRVVAEADPDHVHLIVVNYLENARRYGAPPFRVWARQEGDDAVLRVADAGSGVPDDFVPSLFDTFTQANTGRTGSGLGLAIVKGLAEASGGAAWYEPARPQGACFGLRLPTG